MQWIYEKNSHRTPPPASFSLSTCIYSDIDHACKLLTLLQPVHNVAGVVAALILA
jgi:hypothetical protein